MSFTLYELALQPKIQSRLREEIIAALKETQGEVTYGMVSVDPNRLLQFTTLQSHLTVNVQNKALFATNQFLYQVMSLPYLDMVVSETLRKYPFLSFLDRVASRDYNVPGTDLVIEQGTLVYVSLLGLHYDSKYFVEPETYDPERFSTENKQKLPSCAYMPFGEGPRNCVGKNWPLKLTRLRISPRNAPLTGPIIHQHVTGFRFGQLQSKLGIMKIILNHEVTPCSRTVTPIRFDPKGLLLASEDCIFLNARRIPTVTSDWVSWLLCKREWKVFIQSSSFTLTYDRCTKE